MQLEMLFTSISIGRMEVKNRIAMAPMVTCFASPEGEVTQRMIDYYVARALGGVGLVIVEGSYVRADGKWRSDLLALDRDELVSGLRQLTTAVQEAGAKIAIQLAHAGRWALPTDMGERPVAPSAIHSNVAGEGIRELTSEEIVKLAEDFGEAGLRAKEAGFDAVELHGAHGSLLQQFLSPLANRRADSYGGSLENRLRFPLDVVRKIKQKTGADFPVIYRLNGEEMIAGGLTQEEAREAARLLVGAGADAIDVSIGPAEATVPTIAPPMEVRQGWIAHLAEGIRQVVNVPVIVAGRIVDPSVAERILKDEKADMVAVGRSLLADTEWPLKAERGTYADIRRCIGCNEGCFDKLKGSGGITCLYNPEVGRERRYTVGIADRRKRVVVVGGGPAGMEAARVAALRGHEVALYEQESYLGGQLALAARIPNRGEFSHLIRYYMNELYEAGVKVELGFKVNAAFAEDLAPDVLIIATGSKPLVPWTVVRWTPEAVTASGVVANKEDVGERALILGGGLIGFDTALFLAERRKEVRVVEVLTGVEDRPMPEDTHASMVFERLKERGVEVLSCTQVRNARDGVVTVSHEDRDDLLSRYPFKRILREMGFREFEERKDISIGDYDTLILALGAAPDQSIANELRRRIPTVYIIGDATRPRKAFDAIHQGAEIARRI